MKSSRSPCQITTSPSSTVPAGSCSAAAAAMSGNPRVRSLPWRDHNDVVAPFRTTTNRKPSHFGSYTHPPGSAPGVGMLSADWATTTVTGGCRPAGIRPASVRVTQPG